MRRTLVVAGAIALVSTGAGAAEKTRVEERAQRGPIVGGAIVLGATYAISTSFVWLLALGHAGHATEREQSYTAWMSLPVAGPFVAIGYADGNNATFMQAVAVGSGVLQTAGLALIFYGALNKRPVVVPTVSLSTIGVAASF